VSTRSERIDEATDEFLVTMAHVAQIAPHLNVIHLWAVVHDNCEAFAEEVMSSIVETQASQPQPTLPDEGQRQATLAAQGAARETQTRGTIADIQDRLQKPADHVAERRAMLAAQRAAEDQEARRREIKGRVAEIKQRRAFR
jgi:multidrug efflux pump subunit AcrA (membrane-fusion protein)